MLKDCIEEEDQKLSVKELLEKYKNDLIRLSKYENDVKEVFGLVNA